MSDMDFSTWSRHLKGELPADKMTEPEFVRFNEAIKGVNFSHMDDPETMKRINFIVSLLRSESRLPQHIVTLIAFLTLALEEEHRKLERERLGQREIRDQIAEIRSGIRGGSSSIVA